MSGCENVLCKRCGYLKCDCQKDHICKRRTEAVIALAERMMLGCLAHPNSNSEPGGIFDYWQKQAEQWLDAADAYRKQSTEGGADE
jgi:hypothetical protein